jgi:16S rRNA (adenine1518-N6/adenine1519-N6)-dimethyltransferase
LPAADRPAIELLDDQDDIISRMPSPDVPALLQRYGLRPQKSLGQNFLVDETALRRVVEAAGIQTAQQVLEIGPGLGSLTCLLAEQASRVVCVELDQNLLSPLAEVLQPYRNVQIVQGDILALDPSALMSRLGQTGQLAYLVVANIPYYITSTLMRHLLETRFPPHSVVLTVQREVAERICALPGEMSLLALSVQVYGSPQIVARIPAGAFYPPPKVDSAIIRVALYPSPLIQKAQLPAFFRLAKAGFSQKRKTLRNSLSGGMHWSAAQAGELLNASGIDPMRRAETLSLDEWKELVETTSRLAPHDHQ